MDIIKTFEEEIIEYSKPGKTMQLPPTITKFLIATGIPAVADIFLCRIITETWIIVLLFLPFLIFACIIIFLDVKRGN